MHALIMMLLLAGPMPRAGAADQPARSSSGTVTLKSPEVTMPLTLMGNRPLVEVTIDGKGPYRLILDTGAAGSMLDLGLAQELGLPVLRGAELSSPAGGEPIPSKIVGFDTMRMGDAVISDGTLEAAALKGFFDRPDGPRGVLSAAVFEDYLLTLDYPGKRLVVRPGALPEPDGVDVIAYVEKDGLPAVPVDLAGKSYLLHMDTGAPGAVILPLERADELPLVSPPKEIGRARTVNKDFSVLSAPLDGTLTFGRLTVSHPDIRFLEGSEAGNVGFEILGRFAITIDRKHRRIRFDGPALGITAPRAHPPKRYGLGLQGAGDGPPEVVVVEPGSPAEKAGVRRGDRLLRIQGRETASLGREEIAAIMREPRVSLQVQRGDETLEIVMTLEP